jgi:ParB-like chromosome segregation protein Spo0J
MAAKPGKQKTEVRKLKDLKPFPLQADFFDELSAPDLKALADDIARNGLRQPIQVLPKNDAGYPADTVIAGHQRKRALESLGRTEAEVLVRHDLADKDAREVEKAFLEDNQNRRHLDRLAKARVALRLCEIKRKAQRGTLSAYDLVNVREVVGKQIGLTGRTLSTAFRNSLGSHGVGVLR